MWVRAVCSATYPDANGQPKTVELTHWLTDVSDSVRLKIQRDQEKLRDMNDPNFPLDANGLPISPQTPTGDRLNPNDKNLDPELKKVLDELLKK